MNAEDLTLNIAVNLGRISRFAMDQKPERVKQFLQETENYLMELEIVSKSEKFDITLQHFKNKFEQLKNNIELNKIWAEDMLTWANILQHRAKLA